MKQKWNSNKKELNVEKSKISYTFQTGNKQRKRKYIGILKINDLSRKNNPTIIEETVCHIQASKNLWINEGCRGKGGTRYPHIINSLNAPCLVRYLHCVFGNVEACESRRPLIYLDTPRLTSLRVYFPTYKILIINKLMILKKTL